ncbi:hypothetical protein NDU88_004944 [Pleurodeles waltl]|uniref:Uncharacterized protein n=1 Tax=Pleurodeles waltl TaxID=8319 RepID=A0AAV7NKX3_PLEWA|nr:hypothetical protein NDU88_004944 [Pleurodeles waltl]
MEWHLAGCWRWAQAAGAGPKNSAVGPEVMDTLYNSAGGCARPFDDHVARERTGRPAVVPETTKRLAEAPSAEEHPAEGRGLRPHSHTDASRGVKDLATEPINLEKLMPSRGQKRGQQGWIPLGGTDNISAGQEGFSGPSCE